MFGSHLTFHGVNITVTGKAAGGAAGDPFADSDDEGSRASLVKEIAFDDDGNLVGGGVRAVAIATRGVVSGNPRDF
jgi:hypothetical protein